MHGRPKYINILYVESITHCVSSVIVGFVRVIAILTQSSELVWFEKQPAIMPDSSNGGPPADVLSSISVRAIYNWERWTKKFLLVLWIRPLWNTLGSWLMKYSQLKPMKDRKPKKGVQGHVS